MYIGTRPTGIEVKFFIILATWVKTDNVYTLRINAPKANTALSVSIRSANA
jgi:hypothetical protein